MAIRMENVPPGPYRSHEDVTIVWKGGRIAKLLFPSGKVVRFDCDEDVAGKLNQSRPTENPPVA